MTRLTIWFCLCLVWSSFGNESYGQPIDFDHANLSFFTNASGKRNRIVNSGHWEIRKRQILNGMQEAMGKFPAKRKSDFAVKVISRSKLGDGIEIQTVRLSVAGEPDVVADLYLPRPNTKPGGSSNKSQKNPEKRPAILALHPTGAPGKKIIGGDAPRQNRQYANELAQRGYVVIAPDYPSFGDLKDHDFTAESISGTMRGILNHMRCVDYLESLDAVDADRIAVIGHSLGGHNAIFAAVFDNRLKAVVTSCGWTPFHDYYGGKIAGWTSSRYMPLLKTRYKLDPDQVPFDFYELIAALAPRPFYTNSPLHDSNFDVRGVKKAIPKIEKIYSLFEAQKNVQAVYPKCGHDFPSEIRNESYAFLDRHLNHKPTSQIGFKGELPRAKPLSPDDALKSFNNSKIGLVASEPNVHDPIAMSFDEDKRLFVIEMKDYSEQDKDFLGRVRMLEDQNNDGRFETSTVFADQLSWPTAIICFKGGVFVAAAPDIWFLKDTNGDGKADVKKKVLTGFGRNNVQGLINCLRWGLDNRIHGATSSSGGLVYKVGADPKTAVNLRGGDFSFDPNTYDIRRETGGAQHGMSFDDFGNKFVCSNSDHAQVILFDDRYLKRNPFASYVRARKSIAVDGGQAPVFRSSPVEPWRIVRTRLRVAGRVPGPVEGGGTAAGYFTGSTGITIYRGDANSVDKGTAIIGDVGSNIVHRKRVERQGLDFVAKRIDKKSELVTSTDIWFRPVQFGHGPDGCLYILDMYREVIEHPKSLPPMIKKHLDLTSGKDRGRIYRLGTPKLSRSGDINSELSAIQWIPFLNHPNSWHRETAARIIFQRQDRTCLPDLRDSRVSGFGPIGKIHALWAIKGLGALTFDDLLVATQDAHPQVRRHAVLLAELTNPEWLHHTNFTRLENDPDVNVRWQLAFSIGALAPEKRVKTLWQLIKRSDGHPLMTTAIMSSANNLQVELLGKLAATDVKLDPAIRQSLSISFAQQVAKRKQEKEIVAIEKLIEDLLTGEKYQGAQRLLLTIKRANRQLLPRLLKNQLINDWYETKQKTSIETALDTSAATNARLAAIADLSLDSGPETGKRLQSLLSIDQPLKIQLAVINLMGESQSLETASMLIAKRSGVGRSASETIVDKLLSKTAWTREFLKNATVADFPAGKLELLAQSSDPTVKKRAELLLDQTNSKGLAELMETYAPSLDLLGDAKRGKQVFDKNCSRCHQADGLGFEIGPNLATMKSRGRASILANVLAPNREVNPSFVNYLIQTRDGRSFSGMIDNETETSITLKKEKQQKIEIQKSEIEAIKNTRLSLMPTGLEKEITVEQMADLLEFLMNAK